MSDTLFTFVSIFILFLILLVFLLLGYIYTSYTENINKINKNLENSQDNINNTSKAFNTLQDNINVELNKFNKNQNTIVSNEPLKFNTLNSNILNVFELSSNNIKYTDIVNSNIPNEKLLLKLKSNIISYGGITNITDSNNYVSICDTSTDSKNRKCINLNIDNTGVFNIYPGLNNNTSNVSAINIRNSNNNIMANFDLTSNNISLGSNISPAISITNNLYTPNIIVCNYLLEAATKTTQAILTLTYISNFTLTSGNYLNFIILTNTINLSSTQDKNDKYIDKTVINYSNNILKLKIIKDIPKNSFITSKLNIVPLDTMKPIITTTINTTTNGYLTLS
jgi:hypothetical protein